MNNKIFIVVILLQVPFIMMAQVLDKQLIARNFGEYPMWNGSQVRVMGFTENLAAWVELPNPTLFFNEGDSVHLDLWNMSQGAPHTIHLHGLDVNQQNDGVPHLSFAVHHQEHGFYKFKVPHPGTYIYHCHVVSAIHVQGGMYGMIVVKPSSGENVTWDNGYVYDLDVNWMMSEVDQDWHSDSVFNHTYSDTLMLMPVSLPEYNPQYFLINGKSEDQLIDSSMHITFDQDQVCYLRLANIGNYANRLIFPQGLNAMIVSSDGRPLPEVENSDSLWIFPGERFGVILQPDVSFDDHIEVGYVNLNTLITEDIQQVPVTVNSVEYINEGFENLKSYNVWPNPVKQELNIQIRFAAENTSLTMELFDASGNRILQQSLENANSDEIDMSLDLEGLTTGMYMLRMTNSSGGILLHKIIKQ